MKRGSRIDELMTLLFMLLAVAAVICFFALGNRLPFYICGFLAIAIRAAQYISRLFP
ncbi:MAG: hypothetical protein LBJ23_02215 [Tannerella sp.]|jgi:hypothetical protein|nr:hypothetical protein [Tannerella sp.]